MVSESERESRVGIKGSVWCGQGCVPVLSCPSCPTDECYMAYTRVYIRLRLGGREGKGRLGVTGIRWA